VSSLPVLSFFILLTVVGMQVQCQKYHVQVQGSFTKVFILLTVVGKD
jgi:hypothetical protein